jgi:CrcB protein
VQTYFAVVAGGAIGSVFRYSLSTYVYSLLGQPRFPFANFVINLSGSFLIGILVQLFDTGVLVSPVLRIALISGVLGGYTTFSSFSFETIALLRDGLWLLALINAVGSVLLGVAACWAGIRLAQMI